ncbi:MAG: PAS domain S-box protein [Proteobacteria bacterium]|nr:PAS domain S-box protein [Pseudomonadota bacterium]
MPSSNLSAPAARRLVALLATALAYGLLGAAALRLAIPPGYVAALYPAAGVALAAVLIEGRWMLVGVALGAFGVNTLSGPSLAAHPAMALFLGAVLAIGAVAQAGAGALLMRRVARMPLTLAEPRDVVAFLVVGALSCLVNCSWSTTALWLAGRMQPPTLAYNWLTWWTGDLLGVLIATPIVLCLFGQPREFWAPRRWSVGATLAIATLMLAIGVTQVLRWSNERLRSTFDRDATTASLLLDARLREPLAALAAMRSVALADPDIRRGPWREATRDWLADGRLRALGWIDKVAPANAAAFEERARAEGLEGFHLHAADGAAPNDPAEAFVVRAVEPFDRVQAMLGLDVTSLPQGRDAVRRAVETGQPTASMAFRPGATAERDDMVVLQPVYAADAAAHDARTVRGLVFVGTRVGTLLASVAPDLPPYLSICLLDRTVNPPAPIAGSRAGCAPRSGDFVDRRPLDYAGRQWELRTWAAADAIPGSSNADVRLFALVGLLSAAALGAFLLTVTGRTRRIESAVRERTGALESEMRERSAAEAALRDSEQRFRSIIDNVPIGMLYTDLQGRLIQTNPSLCELIGYAETELMRLTPADYTHPDDVAEDAALNERLVRGEIPMYRRHKRYVSKAGAMVWVRATVSLLRDASGQPQRIVGVVEDITEHLRLQDAERARELAESSSRAKSEFLSRMSHELRTPLNAMLGFAQLLELDQRDPLAEPQRMWVSQIQQAGWHLLEMINDVLDLSRIESGNLRLHTETLDVADLADACLAMVQADAGKRGITITQELAPGSLSVLGDATRVKQILTNLLTNAVKYNVDGGRIHVSSRSSDPEMSEITVTDTGLGMTAEQMANLFQPFNRLGRERTTQEGTGIGLVISQRLAELMGGSLWVRSVAGQGSSFVLALPRALDPDTVRSAFDALAPEPAAYHRRIVHYVEDNETNVEVMRGILAQRPQVEMQVSVTGLDSLAAIRAHRPDLILLDMHLPDIGGLELLHHFKQDPGTATIPVVVVSADALVQQIEAAFEAGASHYLTKPVSVAELLTVLDTLLERIETRYG